MATTRQSKAKNQAEKAAGLERDTQWSRAASAWRTAKGLFQSAASGRDSINYCDKRAERCQVMATYEDDDC